MRFSRAGLRQHMFPNPDGGRRRGKASFLNPRQKFVPQPRLIKHFPILLCCSLYDLMI